MAESKQRFRLLTKRETAERLGISVPGLNRLMALRRLTYVKPTASPRGPVRFKLEDIEAWITANTHEAGGTE